MVDHEDTILHSAVVIEIYSNLEDLLSSSFNSSIPLISALQ